ncbi:MAG: ATP-binding protein [Candidatus Gracilibacteria bacterium]|nr:ATP-binding protein [Candidatus Gracilibacteria bacterium]
MTQKDTGFDAFFKAVTSSPEFKGVVEKDWKGDFEKNLADMETHISKASDMMGSFKDTFETPEAMEAGNSYESKPYINRTAKEDEKDENLDIIYFKDDGNPSFGFAGIAGMSDLKTELKENFIKPLKFKFLVQKLEKDETLELDKKNEMYKKINEAYSKFGVSIPTGLLFYGPPGTGKTFITKKLAEELGAGMIKKSVGEFGSSYIHQTSQNIKKFFDAAKRESEKGPIILFLDEIDSLLSKRTNSIDNNKAEEVSQFLQEFNALDEAPNLIVIAATNRPDHLDSAILRSGRFDKKFYIGAPDFQARKELFEIHIDKKGRPHSELDYDKLAELSENYVAADIEAICDEVARDASQSILDLANSLDGENIDFEKIEESLDDNIITMELLEKAISETTPSTKFVDMSIYDEWLNETKKENIRV